MSTFGGLMRNYNHIIVVAVSLHSLTIFIILTHIYMYYTSQYRSALTTGGDVWEWLRANVLAFVCLVLTFLSLMVVGLLFLYHTYLMLTGQTTWEQASRSSITYFKDLQELYNPFNEGCCCNLVNFLCGNCSRDWEKLYLTTTSSR